MYLSSPDRHKRQSVGRTKMRQVYHWIRIFFLHIFYWIRLHIFFRADEL